MYQSIEFYAREGGHICFKYYFRIVKHNGDFIYFFTYGDLSGVGARGISSESQDSGEDLIIIGTAFIAEKKFIEKAIREANRKKQQSLN